MSEGDEAEEDLIFGDDENTHMFANKTVNQNQQHQMDQEEEQESAEEDD